MRGQLSTCDGMQAPVMPSDGGNGLAMRAGFFLDAYAQVADVDLIIVPVAGSSELSAFVQSRARRVAVLKIATADSHYALVTSVADPEARLGAFRFYGRPSLAAFVGPVLTNARSLVAKSHYDIVHICRLYLAELAAPWLGECGNGAKLVLDCDENDVLAYRRIATLERRAGNAIAAQIAEAEAAAFCRFAEKWLPKFDVVLAASPQEVRSLSAYSARTRTIANVVATPRRSPRLPAPQVPTILFVGTLGYAPNMDGIMWFCTRVFRRLQRVLAYRLRLVIVGRHPSASLARLGFQRGIEVWDDVDDIGRCYRNANFVIAPLRAGGGTRIKIIEAAKQGIPIVTTRLAIEGTSFQNGVDMLVADSAEGFLRACLLLMQNRSLARRLACRARAKVNRDYSESYWRLQVAHLINEGELAKVCG